MIPRAIDRLLSRLTAVVALSCLYWENQARCIPITGKKSPRDGQVACDGLSTGAGHRVGGRRGSDHQAASKAALVSSSRVMSAAARVAASCSGRLAPTIAEVMPGWARTQATLAVARSSARSRAEGFQVGDGLELGRVPVSFAVKLTGSSQCEPRARRRGRIAPVLAREKAAGQRVVDDHADSLVATKWQQLGLDVAVKDVVPWLEAIVPGKSMQCAGAQGQGKLPGGIVRAADVTHLTGTDQVVKRAQGLVDGCFRVGRVGLVEVDVIGPQSPQARVARRQDVPPRKPLVVGPVADPDPAFGGQHQLIAAAPLGRRASRR